MICPQLASPVELDRVGRLVCNDAWVAEQKLDGHRVMLIGPGTDHPTAITRNGTTYTKGLPAAVRNFRAPAEVDTADFILDGELVGDQYWIFDFLLRSGELDTAPLRDRRVCLETFIRMFPGAPFRLVPQARSTDEKEALLLRAASDHLEGLVFKRADSSYASGRRTETWLKAKFVATADVVILAVRDDGKESASLGIIRNGTPVQIGRCSLIGKPAVVVGDVVEVKYLYVPDRDSPRLYQPTLLRVRTDKGPLECDGADLKYTNKSVLAAL